MEKKKIVQRVSLGAQQQALIISHIGFDSDGFGSQTTQGIINIEPGRDGEEMLVRAAQFEWKLSGTPNRQNNFVPNVKKGARLSDDVLATAERRASSISVELEVGDEESEGEETSEEVVQKAGK